MFVSMVEVTMAEETVHDFFCKHMNMEHIEHDDDIFQRGYVNSLFAIQIVNFLEQKFKIKFENEDLTVNNFNTIINICNFINKKLDMIRDLA